MGKVIELRPETWTELYNENGLKIEISNKKQVKFTAKEGATFKAPETINIAMALAFISDFG
jgi:hypothetical protein